MERFRAHLDGVRRVHEADLQQGFGRVSLPDALDRKYPQAATEWGWHPRNQKLAVIEVALAEMKDDLSKYLRLAVGEEIVITRRGRPAGILIGFASEEDWFDYRLEHHPEFLRRIEEARMALRAGRGIPLREMR